MLEVFDRGRRKTAILENAFDRRETEELNAVGSFCFSLPEDDPKNEYCRPYCYVRNDGGALYRILTPGGTRGSVGVLTYQCEHVIATLIDDVLFGAHVVGNLGTYTADCIRYVLGKQTIQNWVLGYCEFARQFEYGWEHENLLAALFSIPNRFAEPYMWAYDTTTYPWKLHLRRIDTARAPQFYVRAGKNLLAREFTLASQEVCTRLYCLGYGEGVNQLTIKSVNNGLPYLQSPPELVEKYGLISRIWVDRRFEDAQSLKERGQVLLAAYQEPQYSITVTAADLYPATGEETDRAALGRVTELTEDGIRTYITGITRNLDTPGDMRLTLATKPVDAAGSIADLADRQRIEQVYSQGATQLYGQSVQANATPTIGAVLNFWIPVEMRIINKVLAKITLDRFRSYSRSTSGGGATTATSNDGGGGSTTSSAGGGGYQSTSTDSEKSRTSGSSSRSTTASGEVYVGGAVGGVRAVHDNSYAATGVASGHSHSTRNHSHSFSGTSDSHSHGMAHTHSVTIPAHGHTVQVPGHSHSVSLPSHSHQVSIPDHTHGIEQGIFEFGSPRGATIKVNGATKGIMGTDTEIDLTAYLLDSTGKIARGQWHRVEIVPDDLAYVTIDMYIQGFVQSRGGSTY